MLLSHPDVGGRQTEGFNDGFVSWICVTTPVRCLGQVWVRRLAQGHVAMDLVAPPPLKLAHFTTLWEKC